MGLARLLKFLQGLGAHARGRHHFRDTWGSRRGSAHMCREKAFVDVLARGGGEYSPVCGVCVCVCVHAHSRTEVAQLHPE